MKSQKGFIQIPISITVISLVILVGIGVISPTVIKAATFDLNPILHPIRYPPDRPDPETGCRGYGDNARTEYEQCRQSYYLKKQVGLLESQQTSQEIVIEKEETITEEEQIIKELESKNQKFQELLEGQNKQIQELIQGLEQESQWTNNLNASLKDANLLNIGFVIIFGAFLICLILLFIKRKRKKL